MEKSLRDTLIDQINQKNWSVEKIAKTTGISEHYLNSLLDGEYQRLPSAPYVRGYIIKLAQLLELDPKALWELHKKEINARSSGVLDRLPSNRFIVKTINKKYIFGGAAMIIVLIYIVLNFQNLFARPSIDFINPVDDTILVGNPLYTIAGKVDARNLIKINNEQVFVDESGNFQKEVNLQPGLNNFEVIASRFLGKEKKFNKQIIYQQPVEAVEKEARNNKKLEMGN